MTNDELKSIVSEQVMDEDTLNQTVVLEGDEFADGCIGITEDGRLVYSYERLVHSLSLHDGMSEESAIEWIEYNTLRSLPYMESQGLLAPVIVHEFDV